MNFFRINFRSGDSIQAPLLDVDIKPNYEIYIQTELTYKLIAVTNILDLDIVTLEMVYDDTMLRARNSIRCKKWDESYSENKGRCSMVFECGELEKALELGN